MDLYLAVLEIVRFPLKLHINLPVSSCGVHVCLMLWCHAWLSQTKVCTLLSLTEEYASARYFHYTIQSEVNMVWEYCDYHWKTLLGDFQGFYISEVTFVIIVSSMLNILFKKAF